MTTTGPLRPNESRNHGGALNGSSDAVSDYGPTHNSTLGSNTIDAVVTLPTKEFGEHPVRVKKTGDRIAYASDEVRVYTPQPKPWWKVFGKDTYEPLVHEVGAEMTARDRAAVQVLFLAGAFSNFLREKLGIDSIADATGGGDVVLAALGKEKRCFWRNDESRAFFGSRNGKFDVSPEVFAHEYAHGLLHHLGVTGAVVHEGFADSLAEYFCYWLAHEHDEAARYFDWKSLTHGDFDAFMIRSFDPAGAANDVKSAMRGPGSDPHKSSGAVRMLFFGLVEGLAAGAEPFSPAYDDAMDEGFAILLAAVTNLEADLSSLPAALGERAADAMPAEKAAAFAREYVDKAREYIRDVKVWSAFH